MAFDRRQRRVFLLLWIKLYLDNVSVFDCANFLVNEVNHAGYTMSIVASDTSSLNSIQVASTPSWRKREQVWRCRNRNSLPESHYFLYFSPVGRDSTKAYRDHGHSHFADSMLDVYYIGDFDQSSVNIFSPISNVFWSTCTFSGIQTSMLSHSQTFLSVERGLFPLWCSPDSE